MNIEDIKKLCDKKEQQFKENVNLFNDNKDIEKIKLIREILKIDNCFFKISANEALNILLFLGVEKSKLKDVYFQLISFDNYKDESILKVVG